MFKSVAGQKIVVYATLAGVPQTGDAANITAYLDKDGGGAVQTNDVNPTELDATNLKGLYAFDMTQAESNADMLSLSPVSSTSNVILEPVIIYTVLKSKAGYAEGAVWVDSTASNTNTVSHVDGTPDNPVSTIAAARTIADALRIRTFRLVPDCNITLAQAFNGYMFEGYGAVVDLGDQSINGSVFLYVKINGDDDGSNPARVRYVGCDIDGSTLGQFIACSCRLTGTITLAETGTYFLDQCYSGVAGLGTPTIDFGAALGVTNLNMRHYSGGIEIENMGNIGADQMSLEGFGQLIISATCDPTNSPVIAVRGLIDPLTDNVAGGFEDGGGTISQGARYSQAQILAAAVDGSLDIQEALTVLLSLAVAKQLDKSDNVYTFKDQSGATKVTITYGAASTTAVIA